MGSPPLNPAWAGSSPASSGDGPGSDLDTAEGKGVGDFLTNLGKTLKEKVVGVEPLTPGELVQARQAVQDAKTMLTKSRAKVDAWDPATQAEARRWFGDDSPAVRQKMLDRIDKETAKLDTLTDASFVRASGENRDAYAYVYPNDDTKVYLGTAFWSASPTGTDSRAGTLVHELSHFNSIAGTRDKNAVGALIYGEHDAAQLAIADSATALNHADCFRVLYRAHGYLTALMIQGLALTSLLACLMGIAMADTTPSPNADTPLSVQLELSQLSGHRVQATVRFRNRSARPVLVLTKFLKNRPDTFDDVFNVHLGGEPAPFTCAMVKRRPPGRADFESIEPGKTAEGKFILNECYALASGRRIEVQFAAFNPSIEGQAIQKYVSNTAHIVDLG